jgi:Flp pilus assembly protein TadB
MFTLKLSEIIGVIVGVGVTAGIFAWLLQKPEGLFVIIVSLLCAGAFQSLKIRALERELRKLKDIPQNQP